MKAIAKRVRRLEAKTMPPEEPRSTMIEFVTGDGTVTGTLVFGPNGTRTWTDFEDPNGPRTWTESRSVGEEVD